MSKLRRTVNWSIAILAVLIALLAWGVITGKVDTAGAQRQPPNEVEKWLDAHPQEPGMQALDAEEFVVWTQTCQDIYFMWSDRPESKVPIFSQPGSMLVYCTSTEYFYHDIYREHDFGGGLVTYWAWFDWWDQNYAYLGCDIYASVPYVYPPDMTTVYWRHLDSNPEWTCKRLSLPLILRPYFTTSTGCGGEGDGSTQAGDPCEPYPSP